MGTIMQRIRDQIQTFIIFQRQPVENGNQNSASSQNNSDAGDKNSQGNSKTDSVRTRSTKQKLNVAEHSFNHPVKRDESSHSEKNANNKNLEDSLIKSSESEEIDVYLNSLITDLKCDNSLETRCSGALNLAFFLANDSPDIELIDCFEALKNLHDSHDFPHLAVCHALLLCAFTKMSMSIEDVIELEENIVRLTESLKRKNVSKLPEMYKVGVLVEEHKEITLKICQEVFTESYLDLQEIDISTICCSSLYNLSSLVQQFDSDLGATYNFKDSTLKYILVMTGRSTQEIVSENLKSLNQKNFCPGISLHRLKHCLHVLEHALSINPDLTYRASLQHESSSLPHCLTRLLGWSVSFVFPEKDKVYEDIDEHYFTFHLSTLICILKVLSILTFNPHQYDNFSNVKGLMEKILICTLKAYFESEKSHFDIQILCLEMLINLYLKNQNTFVLLCLKRFRISDKEEMLAVEALLKMLSDNLEKIKEVKELYPQKDNKTESKEDPTKESKTETSDMTSNNNVTETTGNKSDEDVENEDPVKKLRRATTQDAADGDIIKKPRKETIIDNKSSQDITDEHKNSENTSKETLNEKPTKESSAETDAVLQAASRDMEHSTIVSFICVLIVFFMRTKQNFKEFILERLTPDSLKEATIVSKKFLEFANLTGGMPVTGILILSETITKLQSFQSS